MLSADLVVLLERTILSMATQAVRNTPRPVAPLEIHTGDKVCVMRTRRTLPCVCVFVIVVIIILCHGTEREKQEKMMMMKRNFIAHNKQIQTRKNAIFMVVVL